MGGASHRSLGRDSGLAFFPSGSHLAVKSGDRVRMFALPPLPFLAEATPIFDGLETDNNGMEPTLLTVRAIMP